VARELIGKTLVRTVSIGDSISRLSGTIVETEAYEGRDDPASHARMGPTTRNAVMFGQVGRAYVYFTYGSHYCFNITAKSPRQDAGAVLIRALEPLESVEIMKKYRACDGPYSITSGPGKLAQALQIGPMFNGIDLTVEKSDLFVENGTIPKIIISTPRIGITRGIDRNWRFVDPSSKNVSRPARIKIG
jgi:DNA-3-methyladenine glycosylase